MREFIESLFENRTIISLKYSEHDILFVKERYHTYYLIFFLTNENALIQLKNNTGELHQIIKNNKDSYEVDMDKNITCIYCLKVDNKKYYETEVTGTISELSKKICLVEEDLNYFKKNVFLYTESMDKFASENVGKFDDLCQELITEKNFQAYKKSNVDNYQYDFMLNLFIKLPFLNFQKYQLKNKLDFGNSKGYRSINSFIDEACQKIDRESIINEMVILEERIDDENTLYTWIDEQIKKNKDIENRISGEETADED